jgi:hypothetical protein
MCKQVVEAHIIRIQPAQPNVSDDLYHVDVEYDDGSSERHASNLPIFGAMHAAAYALGAPPGALGILVE